MGGASVAAGLADTEARILMLERGELLAAAPEERDPGAVFANGHFMPDEHWIDAAGKLFVPGNHYNVRGNSKFYCAVLIRYRREDFGKMAHAGGVSPAWPYDYDALAPWYDLAEALYRVRGLGLMYAEGSGVPQDDTEAVKWYRVAAEQGLVVAHNNLGRIYMENPSVPQNYGAAAMWYRSAAEQGFAAAQTELGSRQYAASEEEKMKFHRILLASVAAVALGAASSPGLAQDSIEVVHWWTSGGEAAALTVLKDKLESQGIGWEDSAVAGGGGTQARAVLQARVAAGDPPTAMQMLGLVIHDWGEAGALADLDELAASEGWDEVIPPALQHFIKYDGTYVAAPVNIHSTNWVWANKALFDQIGADIPTTFDELVATLDAFNDAGIIPIAHGGQAWQDATVFEAVVLGAGGADFFRSAFVELDEETLQSDTMRTAFDRFRVMRGYVDDNFPGRDWNLASSMVINGEAAMQFMGDWAKGEFLNAGQVPGEDFICFRFPGTQGSVTFNTDAFAMFEVDEDQQAAQMMLASAVMDPEFQEAFNLVKGSVPARTDVSADNFDPCGQKGMADLVEAVAADAMIGSMAHGHAAPEAVKGAIYDVVTEFFNSDMSSEDAVERLAQAVDPFQPADNTDR